MIMQVHQFSAVLSFPVFPLRMPVLWFPTWALHAFLLSSWALAWGQVTDWLSPVFSQSAFTHQPHYCCFLVSFFFLFFIKRGHHQHPDGWVVHSEDTTVSLYNCRLGQLAELFLHQHGVPFHCGEWWILNSGEFFSDRFFRVVFFKQWSLRVDFVSFFVLWLDRVGIMIQHL